MIQVLFLLVAMIATAFGQDGSARAACDAVLYLAGTETRETYRQTIREIVSTESFCSHASKAVEGGGEFKGGVPLPDGGYVGIAFGGNLNKQQVDYLCTTQKVEDYSKDELVEILRTVYEPAVRAWENCVKQGSGPKFNSASTAMGSGWVNLTFGNYGTEGTKAGVIAVVQEGLQGCQGDLFAGGPFDLVVGGGARGALCKREISPKELFECRGTKKEYTRQADVVVAATLKNGDVPIVKFPGTPQLICLPEPCPFQGFKGSAETRDCQGYARFEVQGRVTDDLVVHIYRDHKTTSSTVEEIDINELKRTYIISPPGESLHKGVYPRYRVEFSACTNPNEYTDGPVVGQTIANANPCN